MEDEELEELFAYINAIEDRIQQIDDDDLYEYVVDCIRSNNWCTLEKYKAFLEELDGWFIWNANY